MISEAWRESHVGISIDTPEIFHKEILPDPLSALGYENQYSMLEIDQKHSQLHKDDPPVAVI